MTLTLDSLCMRIPTLRYVFVAVPVVVTMPVFALPLLAASLFASLLLLLTLLLFDSVDQRFLLSLLLLRGRSVFGRSLARMFAVRHQLTRFLALAQLLLHAPQPLL